MNSELPLLESIGYSSRITKCTHLNSLLQIHLSAFLHEKVLKTGNVSAAAEENRTKTSAVAYPKVKEGMNVHGQVRTTVSSRFDGR